MNGIIHWFAANRVAANLVMVLIVASGLLTLGRVKQEIFPEFDSDMISVSVLYPGASPEETEEGICIRIEEAVQGLEGVKRVTSTATENVGAVLIEVLPDADAREVLDDVKTRVDAIDTFPVEAEKPVIQELVIRRQVLSVAISGDTDESSLKRLGERVRDEISALPGITQVDLVNTRPYEISIEVSEETLRRHGLTFDDVARAVRRSSLDLPGGSVKTEGGEILLRTKGQAYRGHEFEDIVLISRVDGTRLNLGDVATVVDGFEDTDQSATFDGKPSVMVQVYRVGDQGALEVAKTVKEYIEDAKHRMPEGIEITVWRDFSFYLQSRIDLLLRNGRAGFALVFLVLALFLRFRLAFWVSLGIPISFLGAIWLMPALGASINMISLFAFILVLGIVVDDAIVIGESIFTHFRRHGDAFRAAVEGTQEVAVPVVFAVLTTVAAFIPLLNVPGTTGKIWGVIPLVVIPTLLFSMVESKVVLPAHLTHLKHEMKESRWFPWVNWWRRFQERFSRGLEVFVEKRYQPALEWLLRWRYAAVAAALTTLLVTVGLVGGGYVKFVFMPSVEADTISATLTMPQGTPASVTARAVRQIESAALQLRDELDEGHAEGTPSAFKHILASVGEQPNLRERSERMGTTAGGSFAGAHLGEIQVELAPAEDRELTSAEIVARWRELTGPVADAVQLSYTSSLFNVGAPIDIQLASHDVEQLRRVTNRLKARLAEYPGVTDIADSYRAGKQEVKLAIKPEAEAIGLTLSDLARQVRQGFYGEEAQRIQRGRDDIKVMVRYPNEERRSLGDLEHMRIRTPDGQEVPFSAVADASLGRGYASIKRVDRQRVINVTADVDQSMANANEILASVTGTVLPDLLGQYPNVGYSLEGEQKEQRESLGGLGRGFLMALIMIYALMAVPFKSYIHPLVIMSAIPFGLVGAVWGHIIMGHPLSVLSMAGLVALTGVVVNDSLVLVDYINRRRREGVPLLEAVQTAGAARFRPILLTSLTTFAGLTPILLEKSLQAQFLIPLAISLGFGVLFSTVVSLVIVPSGYLIVEDVLVQLRRAWRLLHARGEGPRSEPAEAPASERTPARPAREKIGAEGAKA